tara:strand:+ start:239 stop:553 length:315 start_codon:yes stop_codon:yes gene_type:complete
LASRWALKEAMVKASGCTRLEYPGIYLKKEPNFEIREVLSDGREVTRRIKPKPQIAICGEVNEKYIYEELGIWKNGMHASISHEEDNAIATVTLEALLDVEIEV